MGGIFLAFGLIFLFGFTGPKVLRAWSSQDWVEVPGVIISSAVETHSGSDGATHSVNIAHRYDWEGREYQSNRFDVFEGSSSGYAGKAEIVREYTPGDEAVCFANPQLPGDRRVGRAEGGSVAADRVGTSGGGRPLEAVGFLPRRC